MGVWVSAGDSRFLKYSFDARRYIDSFTIAGAVIDPLSDISVQDSLLYVLNEPERQIEQYHIRKPERRIYKSSDSCKLYSIHTPLHINPQGVSFSYFFPRLRLSVEEERKQYFQSRVLAAYELKDSNISVQWKTGAFPAIYHERFFAEIYPIATEVDDQHVAYVFSKDPVMYLAGKDEVVSHAVEGLPANQLKDMGENKAGAKLGDKNRFWLENELYMHLLYDPVSRSYLLFQQHEIPAENEEGDLNLYEDHSFSIYIINKDFKVVGQKKFNRIGDLRVVYACFYNHTLYLPRMQEKSKQLVYEIYKIKPV